jgi:hypothetical protein
MFPRIVDLPTNRRGPFSKATLAALSATGLVVPIVWLVRDYLRRTTQLRKLTE